MLGTTGSSGCGNDYYPNMIYDWSDITDEKIKQHIKQGYILLKNTDFGNNYDEFYSYDYMDGWDQYFLVKNKNYK